MYYVVKLTFICSFIPIQAKFEITITSDSFYEVCYS